MANAQRWRYRGTERYLRIVHDVHYREWDVLGNLVYDQNQDNSYSDVLVSPEQYCLDAVGFRDRDNPLSLSRTTVAPPRAYLDGRLISENDWSTSWSDVHLEWLSTRFGHILYPDSFPDDDIEFVTRAAANSNPSKAAVQGAVFMAELRDVLSLVRSTGDTMAKYGANEYLKFQYGWRPLVKDLRKIFDVVTRIEKRLNVMNRLRDGGVLRHNYNPPNDANSLKVHTASEQQSPWRGYNFGGGTLVLDLDTSIKTRRWADIIWVAEPPDAIVVVDSEKSFAAARNAVYGLNIDGPTLWHAMPWSWLIDWVHNVSDYVESQNNVVGAKFGRAVLMRQSETITTATPTIIEQDEQFSLSNFSFSSGRMVSIHKERILDVEPGVVQTGDFTSIIGDDFKLSILGALGIQRLRR